MARPGFVLEVDERTPPLLVHNGPGLRREQFPLGTEALYPPDSVTAVDDLIEAVDAACAAPLDSDPLADRLRPGMRLTISFDDLSVPSAKLRAPDIRGRIIERVLSLAAAAGVDDVVLINGIGLNRRNTEAELRHLLGERVFRSFWAGGRLLQHDAEDPDGLTTIADAEPGASQPGEGASQPGEGGSQPGEGGSGPGEGGSGRPELAIHRRVAESDLLVVVHLVEGPGGGGFAAISRRLGSRTTIDAELGLAGLAHEGATGRAAAAIGGTVPVFSIEAVLTGVGYQGGLEFLGRREWEWSLAAQAKFQAVRRGLALAPGRVPRRVATAREASCGVSLVSAGDPTAVDRASQAKVVDQQRVEVTGQADVLVLGVPDLTAYSIGSLTNPVLAAWSALGASYGSVTGEPMVRADGAVIVYHPLSPDFSPLHHPSYVDFFSSVLSSTTDAATLAADHEPGFAADPWWRHLYRTSQAFHGVHPFHRWYAMAPALAHCGDVVVVGGDRASAARLGFRAASTLADALEIVAAGVGHSPRIRYLHNPPQVLADVR